MPRLGALPKFRAALPHGCFFLEKAGGQYKIEVKTAYISRACPNIKSTNDIYVILPSFLSLKVTLRSKAAMSFIETGFSYSLFR